MTEGSVFRRKSRATIVDVARVAGVSDATVSRALNRPEAVSAATRALIDAAIERTGYVPNPLAKAMVSGRTYTIGALVPTLDHAIFAKFLAALEAQLAQDGYNLVVAVTDGNQEKEVEKARKLLSMGIEGLIVSGLSHNDQLVSLTKRFAIPLIATSYYRPDSDIPTIGYDNEIAAQLAIEHLLDLGHRRILVVSGPLANNDRTRSRIKGLHAYDNRCQLSYLETSLDYAGGAEAARSLAPDVTAMLCLSDILAMGALFTFNALGVRVPEDLSLMGFDNLDASGHVFPPLTTLNLPIQQMGAATARAICGHLATGESIPHDHLAAALVQRASTAAPRADRPL